MYVDILSAAAEQVEYSDPSWFSVILSGTLAILGAIFIFVSARAMYLAPDALSQMNMVGPAVGVGIPLLIAADLVHSFATEGFVLGYLIRAIVAITGLLVIAAVGSNVMGRALHATHWDHTVPLSGGQRAKDSF
ncbi:MAG TPA: Na+/H+ antiporter subunit G [Candidatus Corynebacterium gallistercoris]|uniref:Na+/H+ antiporter subunit G n=1 Tax=Candidatus Corynebacterium gallistercoris TaxID=2838530 RepID=A0A9D1UQW4_9CORY|nr:Na+/H+ antiporter subunit G [Candidatus Corynebacterium gallistercoris]